MKQTQTISVTFGEALNGAYKSISYAVPDKAGHLQRKTRLITIPKGVYSGLNLEIDEYLKVKLIVQEDIKGLFKRYGDDVYTTLYLPEDFEGEIPYFTLDGIEKLEFNAPMAEIETLLKFKKKGFPVFGGKKGKRGNLYVRIFKIYS